jgi:hypothetical protein
MNENVAGIIAGIALLVLLMMIYARRQKAGMAESWEAVVTKVQSKSFLRDQDSPSETYIKVEYQRTDGKKGSMQLPEGQFEHYYPGLKVGDRLSKPAGELVARKI